MQIRCVIVTMAGLATATTLIGTAIGQTLAPVASTAVSGLLPSDLSVKGPASPSGGGRVLTPDTGIYRPGDAGVRAQSTYKIFVPNQATPAPGVQPLTVQPATVGPPYTGYFYETPASLACIYKLVTPDPNYWCDPNVVTTVATGGSKAIAIVAPYDHPSAMSDLAYFSAQFGLPAPTASTFQIVYAAGTQPTGSFFWARQMSIDTQWAHAMAPNAKIILVEAATNSMTDLLAAVDVASAQVQAAGGGQVSMSWTFREFSGETSLESHFQAPGVVYFAGTGNNPGTAWPAISPNVVAVGGTSTARAWAVPANKGHFRTESGWALAGSGYSAYFPRPSYQNALAARLGPNAVRVIPDISAVANPTTGMWTYCTTGCGLYSGPAWQIYGGTGLSTPLVAAMVNNAGQFRASSQAQLTFMYSQIGTSAYFDVDRSYCGPYAGFYATSPAVDNPGNPSYQFDPCTGLGSPRGLSGL